MCLLQIGSSPGFEDGDFESAKLRRPAGSYYNATEDCLYFLDSEVCIWIYTTIIINFLANFVHLMGILCTLSIIDIPYDYPLMPFPVPFRFCF